MFERSEQASPISEGVVEIRINSHHVREITWKYNTHEPQRQHEWPPFTMTIKESGWVLPHPSVIFHVKTSMGSPWVARTLSHCTFVKWGKLSSNSATVEATKFMRSHKSRMRKYIINACCNGAQPTRSLIYTGGGYHLQSSKYENRPISLLPIRYSPLSPSCPTRSRIEPT
jgi:hypothetical protein